MAPRYVWGDANDQGSKGERQEYLPAYVGTSRKTRPSTAHSLHGLPSTAKEYMPSPPKSDRRPLSAAAMRPGPSATFNALASQTQLPHTYSCSCKYKCAVAPDWEVERLRDENMHLRLRVTQLEDQQNVLGTEKRRLDGELAACRRTLTKAEELLNLREKALSPTTGLTLMYRKPETTALVTALKERVRSLVAERDKFKDELERTLRSVKATQVAELQQHNSALQQELVRQREMSMVMNERLQAAQAASAAATKQAEVALQLAQKAATVGEELPGPPQKLAPGNTLAKSRVVKTVAAMRQAHRVLLSQAQLIRSVFPPGMTWEEFAGKAALKDPTAGGTEVLRYLRIHLKALAQELMGQPGTSDFAMLSPPTSARSPPTTQPRRPASAHTPGSAYSGAGYGRSNLTPGAAVQEVKESLLQDIAGLVRMLRGLDMDRYLAAPDVEMEVEELADVMNLFLAEHKRLKGEQASLHFDEDDDNLTSQVNPVYSATAAAAIDDPKLVPPYLLSPDQAGPPAEPSNPFKDDDDDGDGGDADYIPDYDEEEVKEEPSQQAAPAPDDAVSVAPTEPMFSALAKDPTPAHSTFSRLAAGASQEAAPAFRGPTPVHSSYDLPASISQQLPREPSGAPASVHDPQPQRSALAVHSHFDDNGDDNGGGGLDFGLPSPPASDAPQDTGAVDEEVVEDAPAAAAWAARDAEPEGDEALDFSAPAEPPAQAARELSVVSEAAVPSRERSQPLPIAQASGSVVSEPQPLVSHPSRRASMAASVYSNPAEDDKATLPDFVSGTSFADEHDDGAPLSFNDDAPALATLPEEMSEHGVLEERSRVSSAAVAQERSALLPQAAHEGVEEQAEEEPLAFSAPDELPQLEGGADDAAPEATPGAQEAEDGLPAAMDEEDADAGAGDAEAELADFGELASLPEDDDPVSDVPDVLPGMEDSQADAPAAQDDAQPTAQDAEDEAAAEAEALDGVLDAMVADDPPDSVPVVEVDEPSPEEEEARAASPAPLPWADVPDAGGEDAGQEEDAASELPAAAEEDPAAEPADLPSHTFLDDPPEPRPQHDEEPGELGSAADAGDEGLDRPAPEDASFAADEATEPLSMAEDDTFPGAVVEDTGGSGLGDEEEAVGGAVQEDDTLPALPQDAPEQDDAEAADDEGAAGAADEGGEAAGGGGDEDEALADAEVDVGEGAFDGPGGLDEPSIAPEDDAVPPVESGLMAEAGGDDDAADVAAPGTPTGELQEDAPGNGGPEGGVDEPGPGQEAEAAAEPSGTAGGTGAGMDLGEDGDAIVEDADGDVEADVGLVEDADAPAAPAPDSQLAADASPPFAPAALDKDFP